MSGFEMFVRTIPFNLYAAPSISRLRPDLKSMTSATPPMATSSPRAAHSKTRRHTTPQRAAKYAGKVIDLIAPMIVMIATGHRGYDRTGYLNGGTNLVEDFANRRSRWSLRAYHGVGSCWCSPAAPGHRVLIS